MSNLVKRWIPILIFATLPGLLVLAGYLLPSPLAHLRDQVIGGAVIVAAFAFLLGVFNVLRVHSRRLSRRRPGWPYSFVLLVSLLLAALPPLMPPGMPFRDALNALVFDYILSPLGASLAALLVFTLTVAVFRLLRTRRSVEAVIFLVVVVIALLGSTPLVGLEWLAGVRDWLVHVPGMAGMRGLLLGVALGTVITALRVLAGSERPHSES
ncbi:MAG TPA: hypothetical protein ENK17_06190 [Anaerolineae bacterium]|nr:hypothetical protein [Anaerolineae bacterium]